MSRPAFIHPCVPAAAARPPQGDGWIHEPKLDGYRFEVIKNGREARLFSKSGAEYTDRLPGMVEAFTALPARAAVLDGELMFTRESGAPHFYALMGQMRTKRPDESRLMFWVFDLLHENGVDLRHLPWSERKRDLARLCRKATIPCMRQVETFPDGHVLLEHCGRLGLEGVVSKRTDRPYVVGPTPTRSWVTVKCEGWRRDNAERWRIFEAPRKPELTEAQKTLAKKRQELARVIERLRSPPLSHGIARELKKQKAILEREIAEMEQI